METMHLRMLHCQRHKKFATLPMVDICQGLETWAPLLGLICFKEVRAMWQLINSP